MRAAPASFRSGLPFPVAHARAGSVAIRTTGRGTASAERRRCLSFLLLPGLLLLLLLLLRGRSGSTETAATIETGFHFALPHYRRRDIQRPGINRGTVAIPLASEAALRRFDPLTFNAVPCPEIGRAHV